LASEALYRQRYNLSVGGRFGLSEGIMDTYMTLESFKTMLSIDYCPVSYSLPESMQRVVGLQRVPGLDMYGDIWSIKTDCKSFEIY
jgi:hypothetical protein